MARLRFLGLAGALFVAALAAGALVGGGLTLAQDGFRVLSFSVTIGLVALVAIAVVALGSGGAQTLDSTYW